MDDTLPPLRDVIARFDLTAKKALGQNFLFDGNLLAKITRAAGVLEGKKVYEVGPGPGGLTRAILAANPASLTVVEKDPRCIAALAELQKFYPGKLVILEQDALQLNEVGILGENVEVIANLPYNVGTALLVRWLTSEPWPGWWSGLTLMFQKEVAQRIVAAPGTDAYGRLSVLAQWRSTPKLMFDVPREAFTPKPKVTSAIVRIVPATPVADVAMADLEAMTRAAFGQRRKMLRTALKAVVADPEKLCIAAGIDPSHRAETISVAGFCRLAQEWRRAGTPLVISATN
jgi:16S rRNA (adenine1518-N6/adenine1519-N6)-dimethyltransferase